MASLRQLTPLALLLCVTACNSSERATTTTPSTPAAPVAPATTDSRAFVPDKTGNALDHAGVTRYPESTVVGTASSPGQNKGETHFVVMSTTKDPVDKVVDFYRKDTGTQSGSRDGVTQFAWRTKQGADVILFIQADNGATKITARGIIYK